MRARGPLVMLASGLVLTGCGADADEVALRGVWQVTAHTRNEAGCAAEGPPVAEPPYLAFVAGMAFGQSYFERVDCTGPTEDTCAASAGLFGLLYAEPIDGGYRSAIYASSGTAASCALTARVSDAVTSDAGLRIETRIRAATDLAVADCSTDEAQRRAAELPCTQLEVLTGVRP